MLNTHPWAARPFVRDAVSRLPGLGEQSPGSQLVAAISDLFKTSIPSNPPRRGKRLDTRWGEFGLLAALYFAPSQFGSPTPSSLRDAWGHIDHAILLYVFGRVATTRSPEEAARYKLVGDELEVAPASTLSDWHTKGMHKLIEALLVRDQFLIKGQPDRKNRRKRSRFVLLIFLVILASLLVWGGITARRVYGVSLQLMQDLSDLRGKVTGSLSVTTLQETGPLLGKLRQDFSALQKDAKPFLWLFPNLEWVPGYGEDLVLVPDLMDLADNLLASADLSYQAMLPILESYEKNSGNLDPAGMVALLSQAQPELLEAQASLEAAKNSRTQLDTHAISDRVREFGLEDVDKAIALMDEGLMLAVEFPRLMGATGEGPKTYLLLAQNEDELRPTGGFITSAGTLLVQDGSIINLDFANSGYLENWERPYPAAPWQLQQYMNSPVLVFRDANWFTDYPTTALYAEYLYSYTSNHSVDGVLAFDQRLLVEILNLTGEMELEGEEHPINSSNVIAYMRSEKILTREDIEAGEMDSKAFMSKISTALIERVTSGQVPLDQLVRLVVKVLDERHLLVQVDNPAITELMRRHGWGGEVKPSGGDFLMVVDSNVGFNKTNAVVESRISYDIDLDDLSSPTGSLVVSHKNTAVPMTECHHWNKVANPDEEKYPITDCYWDYLRLYTLSGTELLGASVQTVPAEWMILEQSVPPQVDILDEKIEGVRGFGTLKVVPGGESISTGFRLGLPASVIRRDNNGNLVYSLKIQKQPGTVGVPITIRLHLPNGATVLALPPGAVVENLNILFQTALVTDLQLEFVFQIP